MSTDSTLLLIGGLTLAFSALTFHASSEEPLAEVAAVPVASGGAPNR